MKTKTLVLSCFIGAVILFIGREYSSAQSEPGIPASKIGIVNIRKVFFDCKAKANFVVDAQAEQKKLAAEIEKLRTDAKVLEAGLQALKPGSPDYMAQLREMWTKRGDAESLQQYNSQQREIKERQLTEDIYREILRITKEIAKEKGLYMVLERTEPEFPISSTEEFVTMLNTHKVLACDGCLDITDEVTARLDAEGSKTGQVAPNPTN